MRASKGTRRSFKAGLAQDHVDFENIVNGCRRLLDYIAQVDERKTAIASHGLFKTSDGSRNGCTLLRNLREACFTRGGPREQAAYGGPAVYQMFRKMGPWMQVLEKLVELGVAEQKSTPEGKDYYALPKEELALEAKDLLRTWRLLPETTEWLLG